MALKFTTGTRTAVAGTRGLKDLFNGGVIDIYSGGQPAAPDNAETGVLLVRISVNSATAGITGYSGTAGITFGTAGAGSIPKSADVWSGVVGVAGVAGYFRLYGTASTSGSSSTTCRMDGNVGVSGSDLVLANTSLTANATLTVDQFTLTVPVSA